MLFDKTIHEPEFLGEAFSVFAKSEGQADCHSCEPLTSIHQFCQRYKMLENLWIRKIVEGLISYSASFHHLYVWSSRKTVWRN